MIRCQNKIFSIRYLSGGSLSTPLKIVTVLECPLVADGALRAVMHPHVDRGEIVDERFEVEHHRSGSARPRRGIRIWPLFFSSHLLQTMYENAIPTSLLKIH